MHSKCINSTSGCKSVTAKVYSATPISYKKRTFRLYTTYHKGGVYYAAQLSEVPGISGQLLQLLQSKFNAAASLVFSARKSEHITPLLRELYWSRVPERIHFRLRVLAYHRLNGITPSYLAETLHLTADLSPRGVFLVLQRRCWSFPPRGQFFDIDTRLHYNPYDTAKKVNRLTYSGVRWLHFKVFVAIQV